MAASRDIKVLMKKALKRSTFILLFTTYRLFIYFFYLQLINPVLQSFL